jgi:hypothetical protein
MPDNRTAEEKINHIVDALHKCQSGEISIESFAIIVGTTVETVPLTEEDFEWARNKWDEIQKQHQAQKLADLNTRPEWGWCFWCGKPATYIVGKDRMFACEEHGTQAEKSGWVTHKRFPAPTAHSGGE